MDTPLQTALHSTNGAAEAEVSATAAEAKTPLAEAHYPTSGIDSLADPALAPLFSRAERVGAPSAWWQHVPFAHWLVRVGAPCVLVELGTHAGVSYTAFCCSVLAAALGTRCFAVDTWIGDAHAGEYGPDVYEDFRRFHDERYASFSTLLRCTFDEALEKFENGCVDLLHIDGLHTYEAVCHDFQAWLPKLSDRAVVLFHDINEHGADFGVWRLWAELRTRYPSFEFCHGCGLGLLAVGNHAPPAVLELCQSSDVRRLGAVRERFARLGERWLFETRERLVQAALAEKLSAAQRQIAETAAQMSDAAAFAERRQGEARQRHAALMEDLIAARQQAAQSLQRAVVAEQDAAGARARAESAAAAAQDAEAAKEEAEQIAATALRDRDVVFASSSWRLTAPARRAMGAIARLRRSFAGTARLLARSPALAPLDNGTSKAEAEADHTPPLAPESPAACLAGTLPTENAATGTAEGLPRLAGAPLRLIWISGEAHTPGHQYRVERPAAAARAAGAKADWLRPDEIAASLATIEQADVLFLWRTRWDESIAAAVDTARRSGAKIVFDIDDLMVEPELARLDIIDGIRSQGLTEEAVRGHYWEVRAAMQMADLCLGTTEELAHRMRRLGKPALVLANSFDDTTWHASRLAARRRAAAGSDGLTRIGYAGGSRTHQRDFRICAEAVAEVLRARPECRVVLFRQASSNVRCIDLEEYAAFAGLEDRIEWRDLVALEHLPEELARFDVNLAPLEVGNPFCEAKSELKFFEAALVGVPTIASPTGPYRRAMRHGLTGFLASNSEEWRERLLGLVDDAELRRRMARSACLDALRRFGPERRARDFAIILDLLRGAATTARAFEVLTRHRLDDRLPPLPSTQADVLFESDGFGSAEVTVVVPLYNYAHTVEETLESVRAQTIGLLDLVVVDDCSTDGSHEVALSWLRAHAGRFNRVVLARNRCNQGLGPTRNAGFALAETPWVFPLDADNRLRPACLSASLQCAAIGGAAFVYPTVQCFGEHQQIWGNTDWNPVLLCNGNYIDAMALISRAAWAEVGGYALIRPGWEDFDLWCRFAERGMWGRHVPGEPLVEYRVHRNSMVRTAMKTHDKVRWMMRRLTQLHPWLTLVPPIPNLQDQPPPPPRPGAVTPRLAALLPLLRCPETGAPLVVSQAGDALLTEDGSRRWPLVEGRPVLFAGMDGPAVMPETHLSNPLPDSAAELIRGAPGPILHLSAGGSSERFDHVVEVEAAIFRHTDLVADVHRLPFASETFAAVIALNAFEHYRDPQQAAREIYRVLRPGGRVLIRTAFLQPEHEAPFHFYNCTRYGLERWFEDFAAEKVWVSDNFHAGYSLSWLASECEAALRSRLSPAAADRFMTSPVERLVSFWRAPAGRTDEAVWSDLAALPQEAQQVVAAGFEYVGYKPARTAPAEGDDALGQDAAEPAANP